ncbi:hypothetical protein BH10PLA2_BH10PLA2_38540 [soil metagenome]
MLATVRSTGESDSSLAGLQGGSASAGGTVSFVTNAFDLARARRIQGILPAAMQNFEARRLVLDQGEDFHDVLTDNPALLTGLLPQEATRGFALAYELGSDNYIG